MLAKLLACPGVRESASLRSQFGFMALHGGSLERGTAEIAVQAADRGGASLYTVVQPEDLRWHVPSALFDPADSPVLSEFLDHIEVVVSIHGYGRTDLGRTLFVGGSNRVFAARAACVLRAALPAYDVVDDLGAIPSELRGLHPDNPVNRPREGGVQLELPPRVRDGARRAEEREALVSALVALS